MKMKEIDKYTDLLDACLRHIKADKPHGYQRHIDKYFYPDIDNLVLTDTFYFIWQFEKVLRIFEDYEEYERCVKVLKVINNLKEKPQSYLQF